MYSNLLADHENIAISGMEQCSYLTMHSSGGDKRVEKIH